MSELLFEGKRFYIFSPAPCHQTAERGRQAEEGWKKDIRYLKSDIEYQGGQILPSPTYNVDFILIHPTHLRELLDSDHSRNDLAIEIPLEGLTDLEEWDEYEFGIVPWTIPKIIERFGNTCNDGRRKEVILKMEWVRNCIDAQRVLDGRYGKYGYAGMRIRSQIAVKAEAKDDTPEPIAGPSTTGPVRQDVEPRDDITDEDLRSIISSPRGGLEELNNIDLIGFDEENAVEMPMIQDESDASDAQAQTSKSKPPSIDLISTGLTVPSGPNSAASAQANDEQWENDIHAEDLGHRLCELERSDIIIFPRSDDRPESRYTQSELERQALLDKKINQKVVHSKWLDKCSNAHNTLDCSDWIISLLEDSDNPGYGGSVASTGSPLSSAEDDLEVIPEVDDDDEDEDYQASQASGSSTSDVIHSATGRPKRACSESKSASASSSKRAKHQSKEVRPNSKSYKDEQRERGRRNPIYREKRIKHICNLLLKKPEGVDRLVYLRGCGPKYFVEDWQKSHSRLNEDGMIDRMLEIERAKCSSD
uniref:BRCT domain-containing protein n=1 Tax=Kwoniella bestiolae CBS 10118 TaxID=1296100 RepID=A0A1B9FVG9_9TREE|nr:hypothetical protein I302_07118 [Kwoniella bestiolae CBS 10118]OCF22777.1 hypothetical protein I302_07118 [Kwoniella bestiolae CBS 10118]